MSNRRAREPGGERQIHHTAPWADTTMRRMRRLAPLIAAIGLCVGVPQAMGAAPFPGWRQGRPELHRHCARRGRWQHVSPPHCRAVRTTAEAQLSFVDDSIVSGTREDASEAIERFDRGWVAGAGYDIGRFVVVEGALYAGAVERESCPARLVSPTAPSRSWSAFATDYFFATDQVPSTAALPLLFSRTTQVPLHALPSNVPASTTSAPSAAGKS